MERVILFIKGMLIGVGNIIPGVSGGTVAVMAGVYDELIGAITLKWKVLKKNLQFLILLGLGMAVGIFAFSGVLSYLFENFPMPTSFAFMGLIIGSLPDIAKRAAKSGYAPRYLLPMGIAIGVMAIIAFVKPDSAAMKIGALSVSNFFLLFFAGLIAAVSMIVPGISGSFVLLVIGLYEPILHAVAKLNIPLLIPVVLGAAVGILGGAKVIDYLLHHYTRATYFAILGLVAGSLLVLYPGFTVNLNGIISLLCLVLAALVSYLLTVLDKKSSEVQEVTVAKEDPEA